MSPAVLSLLLSGFATSLAVFGTVWAERRVRAAERRAAAATYVNNAVVSRLASGGCDVCGRPFADGAVNVRVSPAGEASIGHPFCFGPLPEGAP